MGCMVENFHDRVVVLLQFDNNAKYAASRMRGWGLSARFLCQWPSRTSDLLPLIRSWWECLCYRHTRWDQIIAQGI